MKSKINKLATHSLGLVLVAFALNSCASDSGGTHMMGSRDGPKPMADSAMHSGTSGGNSPSRSGTHNMGNNRNVEMMPDEKMPSRR